MTVQQVKRGLQLLGIMYEEYGKQSQVTREFNKRFAEAHSDMLSLFTEELGIPAGAELTTENVFAEFIQAGMKAQKSVDSLLEKEGPDKFEFAKNVTNLEGGPAGETQTLDLSGAATRKAEGDLQMFDKYLLTSMVRVGSAAKLYFIKRLPTDGDIPRLQGPNGDIPRTALVSVIGDGKKAIEKLSKVEGDGLPTACPDLTVCIYLLDICSGVLNFMREKKLPILEDIDQATVSEIVAKGKRALKYHAAAMDLRVPGMSTDGDL